jgi:hypothetical protein
MNREKACLIEAARSFLLRNARGRSHVKSVS